MILYKAAGIVAYGLNPANLWTIDEISMVL